MKSSARQAARKWSSGLNTCGQRPMAVFAMAMLVTMLSPADARPRAERADDVAASQAGGRSLAAVPLPRPRPADAPVSGDSHSSDAAATEPATSPPQPSACRLALTEAIAIAPSIAPIRGPGACGGEDLVRLEAVVLPDKGRVAVKPAAILRCGMATAVADWIRNDMAPLAAGLATRLAELDNFDSFECRGRNRVAGAKLSEHGRANALDVRGLKLANGQSLSLTDRGVARDVREKVLGSVCGRFTTVLGPGSDGYHEDHIHLDLAERRNGYRICHWEVYGPLPGIAPLLPAPRPDDAPPREVASQEDVSPAKAVQQVEQLKVQPAAPPAVSLSPVPLAKQSTDVAKPSVKVDNAKSDDRKPDVNKADVAKPRDIKPEAAKKPETAKADRPAATTKPATATVPVASSKTAARATRSTSQRSKRSRARNRQPDLPVFLRKMFE